MAEIAEGAEEAGPSERGAREAFADGVLSLLKPVVAELDARVKATRQSQILLRSQIDELAEELRGVSEATEAPFALQPYVAKLQDSRRRIAVVASILHNTQERLGKLQTSIAKETTKRKSMLEQPLPHPPPS